MNNDSLPAKVRLTDGLGPLVERLLKYSDIRRNDPRENREALRELIVGELADEVGRMQVQIDGLKFDALGETRTRYVRVTLDGSHCVMDAREGDRYVQEARADGDDAADRYEVRDVYLSEREFDDLPEFDGF